MIDSIQDARFILTFGDCLCESGDQLTCDAELSVTETVSENEVLEVIEGLKSLVKLNDNLSCDGQNNQNSNNNSTVQISVLNGSAENLSNESQNLSSCLDWVRPANWTPKNDPNWIPMNACCGPKKYNNNMSKCCSGNNVYSIYDDG